MENGRPKAAAVTIGGGISGVGGMLLGVPLAATIYKLIKEDVRKRVPEKQNKEEIKEEKDKEDE